LSHHSEETSQIHAQPAGFRTGSAGGFTLIELIFALTVLGLLMGMVVPKAEDFVDRARVTKAIGDINAIQLDIDAFAASTDSLPTSLAEIGRDALLDPWGNPYVYNNFSLSNGNGVPQGARRDRFLVPINSTYDLFSMGKDGQSVPALTARASKDDIVRGNDGGFIGLGNLY
jgi:general secretion pathway protein G